MKLGLLIIDLQKAYYNGYAKESMDQACEYINAVLPLFREAKLPIAWIQDVSEFDGVVPGTEAFELIDILKPNDDLELTNHLERRFHKYYGNSFNKTGLDAFLKEQGVDTVIVTGYRAEFCVLSTYRGALDLDYTPILLRGGVAGGIEERINFVYEINDIISYNALSKLMKG
ncbi:cysteine hydrolase family protein [Fusibacter bizertensis]